jgi:hypothetical protein
MASELHEAAVRSLYAILVKAMESQEEVYGNELDWVITTNLSTRLEDNEYDRSIKSCSKFVGDITVVNEYGESILVIEFALTQSRVDAIRKIRKILARNPST